MTSRPDDLHHLFAPSNADQHWYALYTKPRAEKKLNDRLNEKGIVTYLPLQKQLRQWSDRKKWVEEPIFRGYLFVRATEREFQSILNTPGTVNFVRFGGKPAPVDASQLEAVHRIINYADHYEVDNIDFHKGERVRIDFGSLKGIEGEWISWRGQKRVAVQIHQLGRLLAVEVPAAHVVKV
jgi:transcription antitermination factor NusG